MKSEVRIPDVEVIVSVQGSDIFGFAAWLDKDIHQGLQSVVAIDAPTSVKTVITLLQAAITKVSNANWKSLDELDSSSVQGDGTPPW